MKASLRPSLRKEDCMKVFSAVRFVKDTGVWKKKQTFDFDDNGIISKFVNNAQNTMLDLPELGNMSKKLSELRPGQKAIILNVDNLDIHLKLMEMGCLPGEEISIEQIAPLGDPVSVQVAGYRLSLRLDEAQHIVVDLIN